MKLKLQSSEGSFITELPEDSTLNELKDEINKLTKINKNEIKILSGYPPKNLEKDDTTKIKDCNINSGDTLIVGTNSSKTKVKGISKKKKKIAVDQKGDNTENSILSEPFGSGTMSVIQEEICLICEDECMIRIPVPSDNSCLFTCVYFITHCGILDTEQSNNLRKIIADAIEDDPEKYNEVYLGRDNADYCQWIMNPNSWGGAIELSIFADYFKIEITCVDIMSGAVLRFGQDKFSLRGILIYDGIHYDPLVIECSHLRRAIFPAKEQHFLNLAMGIVREARSSRQFTDIKNFKLRCGVCGLELQGDEEARLHAAATSHDEFGEIL